jgi:hypothetical protein
MTILPHATRIFDAVGLYLCPDSPQDRAIDADWQMGVDEACGYLDRLGAFLRSDEAEQLAVLPSPTVVRLMGGEPFYRPDDLERVVKSAVQSGMASEIWTTAAWVEDRAGVRDMVRRFQGTVHAIQVTTNRRLIGQTGVERIEMLMEEVRRAEMGFVIRCSVGPGAPLPRELLAFEAFNSDSAFMQVVPLPEITDGSRPPDPDGGRLLLSPPPTRRRCASLFAFFVMPGGDAYPCDRGVGMAALRLGSLKDESVSAIMRRTVANAALRKLHDCGPQFLYQAVQAAPEARLLYRGYVDACHFHHHLLSDSQLSSVVAAAESEIIRQAAPPGGEEMA